jgi:hypothetical protein
VTVATAGGKLDELGEGCCVGMLNMNSTEVGLCSCGHCEELSTHSLF